MDGESFLYTLLEAGVALAGFSAIALALETRGTQQIETRQRAVITVQVLNAIGLVLSQGLWWYALGVAWLLVSAGYTFVIYIRAWIRAS